MLPDLSHFYFMLCISVLRFRFEKLAQICKKDLDILQLAQAQGLDPPSHHFEERTFKIVRYGCPKDEKVSNVLSL